MSRKPLMLVLLLVMVVTTVVLIGAAAYLFLGDRLPMSSSGTLHVYIQSLPQAVIGEDTDLIVTVRNDTGEYLSVEEIRLPQNLLDAADVASILPGTLSKTEYEGQTGYQIGYLLAPGTQREFAIKLVPQREDDILGDITVLAGNGKWKAVTGFRLNFVQAVAQVNTPEPVIPAQPTLQIAPTDTTAPSSPTPTSIAVPYGAVVKITAQNKHSSYLRDEWSGSGSIVSPDGLILTNAHLVDPGRMLTADYFEVSITDDPAVGPVPRYFAKPVIVDEDLDLAVMVIATDLKYNPVDMGSLNLTPIPIGDSSLLKLGDPLTIMGYPGIGGESITLTKGDVGGFSVLGQDTSPSFIKTSGTISGGTSGGAVLDQFGSLVAVPTQLGYGQNEGDMVDCRVIADTNNDGKINQKDVCIPVGGFINALRPINLAIPLIEKAKQMISLNGIPGAYPYPTP